jgi:hypothetical protein
MSPNTPKPKKHRPHKPHKPKPPIPPPPPPPPPRNDVTVELRADGTVDPQFPRLSEKGKDRIRWWNKDVRGHTLTFQLWPFVEAPGPIQINAGKKSKWFTVFSSAQQRGYDYDIDPPITPPNQGPDTPAIIADP